MRRILAFVLTLAFAFSMAACGTTKGTDFTGVEDGVLTVAMECAYAPYNWSQTNDKNGAVPIKDSDEYANGYDVMMAKKICEKNGWDLEIVRLDWDSLIPAVQTGQVDAVIAGQSMTSEREKQVDFAGPYLYASIVCVTLKNSDLAKATKLSDFAGHSCTSQLSTVWYDTCLPQIEKADIKTGKSDAPAMLMALETGDVDFVCTDMPTALAAVEAYDDMTIVDFANAKNGFQVSDEEINIGISVMKGNTTLKDAINTTLSDMSKEDFNNVLSSAIAIQPVGD